MECYRKPVAMMLPLLISLITLQIADAAAGRNVTKARSVPEIIPERAIVAERGNNTRVTRNALAENASKIGDRSSSNGDVQRSRRSKQTSSNPDQDAIQSYTVDMNDEDVEMLKRVIAKYEPQRITSRKTKRKIVEAPNITHDTFDEDAALPMDFERAYAEVLRNISQKVPESMMNNADVASNPYLSQVMKNLKQIYIPNVTILSASDDGALRSRSVVDSTYTSTPLRSNKAKKSFNKYIQSPIIAIPSVSIEKSKFNDEIVNGNGSSRPQGYFEISNARTKLRNESLSNIYSNPKEKGLESKWTIQDPSLSQIASPFTSRLNDSNKSSNLNIPSNLNAVRLPPRRNTIPKPFSISHSPASSVRTNHEISHRKSSLSPAGFNQPNSRSSASVLPLVLPTDLVNAPPARRYVPIKRTNHLGGDAATTVSSQEISASTSPVRVRTTLADYGTLYADVIGTTRDPTVAVNGQRSSGSSDYYAITENPAERIATNSVYIPSQTSASFTLQRQSEPRAVRNNQLLPRVVTYKRDPDNERSDLNENPGIVLYNKFASLYSTDPPNVSDVSKAITQDYRDSKRPAQSSPSMNSQQQVSTQPYETPEPTNVALPKVRPIATVKSAFAPYYDSKLLHSQGIDGKFNDNNKDNEESVETNERSSVKNVDESEKEVADGEIDISGNYKSKIDRKAHKAAHKAPNEEREKDDRYSQRRQSNYGYYDNNDEDKRNDDKHEGYENDEDEHYPQQRRDYEQDGLHEYDNDKGSKNDDRREKYKNPQREDNEDEEDIDETQGDEYVSVGRSEDENNRDRYRQYDKYDYDRDDTEEEQHYDRKKYDKPKDKNNHEIDIKQRLESNNKYSTTYDNDDIRGYDKEYRDRREQDKSADDNRYEKDRRDGRREDDDDESAAANKPFLERLKDQHSPRLHEGYKKKQNKGDDTIYKHKYHNYHLYPTKAQRDHGEQKREEYGETNPKHVREEYHHQQQQHVKGDRRDNKHDAENQNDHVHGETQEHAHKHEKKDGGDRKFEEGGGAEHHEEHHGDEGEKGDKGYKVWHEHEKAEKGHHDKEHQKKDYEEKDGQEKKHEEEGGYHKQHDHDEAGKKTAEFGEKGEHKKGHTTHGEHSVHKKDEYEKNTEFFDEFHEDGGEKKQGGHHHEHETKKGGHEKKGHHDIGDHEEKHGKEEKHEKGGHHHENKGHKIDEGHDHHYDRGHKFGKKDGHEHAKKWSFKKGDGDDGHKS